MIATKRFQGTPSQDWFKWSRLALAANNEPSPAALRASRLKTWALGGIGAAILVSPIALWAFTKPVGWRIVESAEMNRHAGQAPAQIGGIVRIGEGLTVGPVGKGVLRSSDEEITISLEPQTSLRFDKTSRGQQVTLLSGATTVQTNLAKASAPFTLRIGNSQLFARDSVFKAEMTPRGVQLSVESGALELRAGPNRPAVEIGSGRVLHVGHDGSTVHPKAGLELNLNPLFNLDAVTTQSSPLDGEFDLNGASYPAEGWKETIDRGKYVFRCGSPSDGKLNSLRLDQARAVTFDVPPGAYPELRILCAAWRNGDVDRGRIAVKLEFRDGSSATREITVDDWCVPKSSGAIALRFSARRERPHSNQAAPVHLYDFPIALNPLLELRRISFSGDAVVFAATLLPTAGFHAMAGR